LAGNRARLAGVVLFILALLLMGKSLFTSPSAPLEDASISCSPEERRDNEARTTWGSFGPDEKCLPRERIEELAGFSLPTGARNIKSSFFSWQDAFLRVQFTLDKAELEDFLRSSERIPHPLRTDCRLTSTPYGLGPGTLTRCVTLTTAQETREIALDETSPTTVTVYYSYSF
jgi:hypothetical protein